MSKTVHFQFAAMANIVFLKKMVCNIYIQLIMSQVFVPSSSNGDTADVTKKYVDSKFNQVSSIVSNLSSGIAVDENKVAVLKNMEAGVLSCSSFSSVPKIVNSNYTALANDYYIAVTATGGCTITLPSAAGINGKMYKIVDMAGYAGSNQIVINCASSNINGKSATTSGAWINRSFGHVTLLSDGTNWFTSEGSENGYGLINLQQSSNLPLVSINGDKMSWNTNIIQSGTFSSTNYITTTSGASGVHTITNVSGVTQTWLVQAGVYLTCSNENGKYTDLGIMLNGDSESENYSTETTGGVLRTKSSSKTLRVPNNGAVTIMIWHNYTSGSVNGAAPKCNYITITQLG